MGERMDGWPLCWRREGRAGWREVVLEMEEKKRGDINLAEGRPACLSLSLPASLHTHTHIKTQAHYTLQPFLSHKSEGLSSPACRALGDEIRKIKLVEFSQRKGLGVK